MFRKKYGSYLSNFVIFLFYFSFSSAFLLTKGYFHVSEFLRRFPEILRAPISPNFKMREAPIGPNVELSSKKCPPMLKNFKQFSGLKRGDFILWIHVFFLTNKANLTFFTPRYPKLLPAGFFS